MSNRRKIRASTKLPRLSSSEFNRLARPSCSSCGGPITWMDGTLAAEQGLDVGRAASFLGEPVEQLEFWICARCGDSGAFGAAISDL